MSQEIPVTDHVPVTTYPPTDPTKRRDIRNALSLVRKHLDYLEIPHIGITTGDEIFVYLSSVDQFLFVAQAVNGYEVKKFLMSEDTIKKDRLATGFDGRKFEDISQDAKDRRDCRPVPPSPPVVSQPVFLFFPDEFIEQAKSAASGPWDGSPVMTSGEVSAPEIDYAHEIRNLSPESEISVDIQDVPELKRLIQEVTAVYPGAVERRKVFGGPSKSPRIDRRVHAGNVVIGLGDTSIEAWRDAVECCRRKIAREIDRVSPASPAKPQKPHGISHKDIVRFNQILIEFGSGNILNWDLEEFRLFYRDDMQHMAEMVRKLANAVDLGLNYTVQVTPRGAIANKPPAENSSDVDTNLMKFWKRIQDIKRNLHTIPLWHEEDFRDFYSRDIEVLLPIAEQFAKEQAVKQGVDPALLEKFIEPHVPNGLDRVSGLELVDSLHWQAKPCFVTAFVVERRTVTVAVVNMDTGLLPHSVTYVFYPLTGEGAHPEKGLTETMAFTGDIRDHDQLKLLIRGWWQGRADSCTTCYRDISDEIRLDVTKRAVQEVLEEMNDERGREDDVQEDFIAFEDMNFDTRAYTAGDKS